MALEDLGNSIKDALGLGEPSEPEISWRNRLQPAAYTPASGVRITFDYADLEMEFEQLGKAFNFPDAVGTYIQRGSQTDNVYPMRIFLAGADYDIKAAVFLAALKEEGPGTLEHPLYGVQQVDILGRVKRSDRLVTAGGQAVFELIFYKTITDLFPEAQEELQQTAADALDAFGLESAEQFASALDLNSGAEEKGFLDTVNDLLDKAEDGLGKIAAVQDVIQGEFDAIADSIKRGIDVLVGQPLALAFQTKQLINSPAQALADIRAQLDAYGGLAEDIFGGADAVSEPGGVGGRGPGASAGGIGSTKGGGTAGAGNDSQSPNRFHTRDLFASSYMAGAARSALSNEPTTKQEAIETASTLLEQLSSLVEWQDDNYNSLSGGNLPEADQSEFIVNEAAIDNGAAFQELQQAVTRTVGFLITQSLQLRQEVEVTLDRERALMELVADLYQTEPDGELDFFIESNALTADEVILIPKGRRIVFFL
jgi:hypothetical protein